jgi:hypothetical protein
MRLSVLAVAMNPGSKVKTPWSLVSAAMSITSGPMLPERAGNSLVLPEARSFSSNFLLAMACDSSSWKPSRTGNGLLRN